MPAKAEHGRNAWGQPLGIRDKSGELCRRPKKDGIHGAFLMHARSRDELSACYPSTLLEQRSFIWQKCIHTDSACVRQACLAQGFVCGESEPAQIGGQVIRIERKERPCAARQTAARPHG